MWPRQVSPFEIHRQLVEVYGDDVVKVQHVRSGAGSSKMVERTSVVISAQVGGCDGSTSGGTDFGKPTSAIGNSGVPRNFFRGGSTNSVEDRGQRERGSGGSSPLVRGSGGSCNLVQEISFHMVKFS